MRLLLRAHGVGAALMCVPQARLLRHPAARLDNFNLALDLVLQRCANKAEAVHVFHFRFGAELLLPARTHAYIGVTAQRPLFHVAVGDAAIQQDFLQTRQVLVGFVGCANIRLGDNLHQRRAAAVQVQRRVLG